MGIAGGGDIPTDRADSVPPYLQRDIVPAVRHESSESLPSVDAVAIQKEPGMGIGIIR